MNIARQELTKAFHQFAQEGHGVVVGHPGAGKTYMLSTFCRQCLDEGRSCLYLPIDKLGVETLSELREVLGYTGDFISYLRSQDISPSGAQAYLVIDAFDAARSDKSQRLFLNLIQMAMRDLPAHWRVIASVRTYDARKSQDLLSLFPRSAEERGGPEFQLPDVKCRHFCVPLLTVAEADAAASAFPGFQSAYAQSSPSFRELLRTPFHLWLVEQLSADNTVLPRLTAVYTEVELLNLFWQERVLKGHSAEGKQFLATRIARALVDSRSLSVRKDQVFSIAESEPWRELLSSGVLAEEERGGQRVSFAHNILFDFAVSELLIEDNPQALESFLAEDRSRPLFLRPSLNYYFTNLWHGKPDTFWDIFWHVIANPHPDLRLFARLLPATVIARELADPVQIEPLLIRQRHDRATGDQAILRVLQALKALDVARDATWSVICEKLSQDCSDRFIGELAQSVAVMHERVVKAAAGDRDRIAALCGSAARNMLKWVWERRQREGGKRYDGLGSFCLVPLVAKTFGYAPADARAVLEPVWDLVNEESFPIDYLSRLTDNIAGIWRWDPVFVAKTFETVFSYHEQSDAKTSMGTPIMPITSNRRQDYRMCHYHLKNAFPGFLKVAPRIACETAVRCLTPYMVGSHVVPYLREGVDINETIETFQFRGRTVRYIPDHSYIWAQSRYPEEPIEIADEVATYLRTSAAAGDTNAVQTVIDVLCDNLAGAYFWRQLFLVASEHPAFFIPLMWNLAGVSSFQIENDTVHELGLFLTAAAPITPRSELRQIEESVLALVANVPADADSELYIRRRNRLLNCIGLDHLQKPESKDILAGALQQKAIPENRPLARFESSWKPYTEQDHLKDRGVDVSIPENREIFDCFEPLGKFSSEWQNKKPSVEAIQGGLPALERAWSLLKKEGNRDAILSERLLTKCGECAETMARGIEGPDSHGFTLCREILLECAVDVSPEPTSDDDDKYRHASWSPAPRNEAAQGLPWLAARIKGDGEIIAAIENLAKDKVPSVRYLAASELFRTAWSYTDDFWRIVEARAKSEANRVVQDALCHSLSYAIQKDEQRACKVLDGLIQPAFEEGQESELLESIVHLVMGLYIERDNQWAEGVSNRIIESPKPYRKALTRAILDALSYITPAALSTADDTAQAEKARAWVLRGVDAAAVELSALLKLPKEEINEQVQEVVRSLYSSIDEVIMRLYFAAGIFEGGKDSPAVSDVDRERYYHFVRPMLDRVIDVCDHEKGGLLFASTAHYFMELLNGVLAYDVKHVLHLAHNVARVGTSGGYNLDSMAVREVVKLIETILANHRVDVRDGDALEDLLGILDIFSDVGWPDAMKLVWRLDEVFR